MKKFVVEKEEIQLLEGIKDVNIPYCQTANQVRFQKRWVKPTEKYLTQIVKPAVIPTKGVRIDDISIFFSENPFEDTQITIKVTGEFEGEVYTQEYDSEINFRKEEKPAVSKEKAGNYYTGILQLRNSTKEMTEFVITRLDKSDGVFASKILEKKEGVDFYLSNNTWIRNMGVKLQKHFGGTLKADTSVHTYDHQKSKEVHRINVTLFCFPFTKHDIVEKEEKVYDVLNVHKKATLQEIHGMQRLVIDAQEAREYAVLQSKELPVMRHRPHVMVMHPFSYQEVEPIWVSPAPKVAKTLSCHIFEENLYYKKK